MIFGRIKFKLERKFFTSSSSAVIYRFLSSHHFVKELSVRDKKHVVHDIVNYTLIQIVWSGAAANAITLSWGFLNTMHRIYTFLHNITPLSDLRVTITNLWVISRHLREKFHSPFYFYVKYYTFSKPPVVLECWRPFTYAFLYQIVSSIALKIIWEIPLFFILKTWKFCIIKAPHLFVVVVGLLSRSI